MSFTASLSKIVAANHCGLLTKATHWERVRLGSVATILNGFPFPSQRFTRDRGIPLLRIRDVMKTSTDAFFDGEVDPQFMAHPGELVVGMDGDFNSSLWRGPVAALNQRVCKITPDERVLDRRFLTHVLPGYLAAINAETSAITVKHLSSKTVGDIPIPLPPVAEQRRIVAALEEHLSDLDAAVAGLERARNNVARYRNALITTAVVGSLETRESWTDAPRLPHGWEWTKLREAADIKGGITKGQKRRPDDRVREVPYLRVANVQRGYLDLREVKCIAATEREIGELHLRPGDVLFNEGGDRDKLGRGWVWSGEVEECIHQNHVFRARVDPERFNPKFVSYFGNTWGQRYFIAQGKQTTNLASINLTKLGALPIPAPTRKVQDDIVDELERRLAVADRTAADIAVQLARGARLRQSILKRAFEGRLVSQNACDEPASALLTRTRESAATPATTSRTRASRSGPTARSGHT